MPEPRLIERCPTCFQPDGKHRTTPHLHKAGRLVFIQAEAEPEHEQGEQLTRAGIIPDTWGHGTSSREDRRNRST
jgi:hypothetical protein